MDLLLYGAGGHAKAVIATIEALGTYSLQGILDDDPGKHGADHFGYRVVGGFAILEEGKFSHIQKAFVAIGDNQHRFEVSTRLRRFDFELVTLVHPRAERLRDSYIGKGSLVFPRAFIGGDVVIGEGVIVSVGAVVGHDARVKDYGQLCPNVTLSGGSKVGEYAFIGSGTTILPGVEVADHVIVGANSVVNQNLPSGVTAVGSPARIIKRGKHAQR